MKTATNERLESLRECVRCAEESVRWYETHLAVEAALASLAGRCVCTEQSVRWYEAELAKAKGWLAEAREWLAKAEAEEK